MGFPGQWCFVVALSYVQVVGGATYASQTMDAAFRCSTHKEYNPCIVDTLHLKWNKRFALHHFIVNRIARDKEIS